MQNINLAHVRAGRAIVQRDGETIGYVTRDDLIGSPNVGKWETRPVHDALVVGKAFPLFATRREAVQHIADSRWP